MAKSIEEAFKKVGLTNESLRKKTEIATPGRDRVAEPAVTPRKTLHVAKSFKEQMKREGVTPVTLSASVAPVPRDARIPAPPGASAANTKRPAGKHRTAQGRANTASNGRRRSNPSKGMEDLNRHLANLSQAYGHDKARTKVATPAITKQVFEVIGPISLNSALVETDSIGPDLLQLHHDGIALQIASAGSETDEVDMVIGVDFGTSSAKVIVRDKVRGVFAVQFFADGNGNPYLLPSRLYEYNSVYQLDHGGSPHRDLKLSLLRKGTGEKELERAAAFLALVIRYSRGWLLSEKAEIYRQTRLNWSINLGLPAANYQDTGLVRRFRALAIAAMNLAANPSKTITCELAAEYCRIGRQEAQRDLTSPAAPDISTPGDMVDVVPEIAAQIYGFVQSARFDNKAENIYMMVDVGAGTVDASIFHVRKEPANRHGFVFFANNVEQNGVMNLHRERIDWLSKQCSKVAGMNVALSKVVSELGRPTDRLAAIPEQINSYFEGIALHFNTYQDNPDEMFFQRRYWRQVFGGTLNFVRDHKLREEQLIDLPFFLAGGGARMDYYERLVRQINNNQNIRWAHLRHLPMERPKELEAPGLREKDYDRLSVAFGLSFLKLGTYIRAQDVPDLPPRSKDDYYDRFISKDQI